MGTTAIGIGILLGMFGPVLLIPVVWAVHRWITKRLIVPRLNARFGKLPAGVPFLLTVLLVSAVVAISYVPGRLKYEAVCDANAPQISQRLNVDGLYVSRLYPHEAGRYLYEHGFAFVEAPSLYKKADVRYSRGENVKVREEPIASLLSRYGMRDEHLDMGWGVSLRLKTIYEIASDRVIAKAGAAEYFGGPLFFFLGVYGLSHCPDVRTPRGSEDFKVYHDLAGFVLREATDAETADWFGKTGLSAETERYLPIYVRQKAGKKRFEPGAPKASDLSYVGSFQEGESRVHYWRVEDKDLYAYVVVTGKWTSPGMGDRKPPTPVAPATR